VTTRIDPVTEPDLTIPAAGRLVHIGFPKTGTTFLQGALSRARPQLREHDVVYPGKDRYHKAAGVYISRAIPRRGDPPVSEADWLKLVKQTNAAGDKRVIISSEWLSETGTDDVRRVVEDLGGDQVHIVATLRPLAKIMPSAWQQYLQNGARLQYDRWLRGMLLRPPYDRPTPSFWKRHRHDEILARWAEIAGPDHVTAIIVDSRDHQKLLRQFESMLALPDGVLVPEPPEKDNRSLTWPEAEMIRLVNNTSRGLEWPDSLYRSTVRQGVLRRLAELRPESTSMQKLELPKWAMERATEIGAEFAKSIAGLGIRVVGDLDSLGALPSYLPPNEQPPALVPADVAAEAIIAAIASGLETGHREGRAAAAAAAASMPSVEPRVGAKLPPRLRRALVRAHHKVFR
jgi:hypothetical protein